MSRTATTTVSGTSRGWSAMSRSSPPRNRSTTSARSSSPPSSTTPSTTHRPSDNEAASARLADRELAVLGWDEARRGSGGGDGRGDGDARCRPTATGTPRTTSTIDTAVLLDADLAVLGSEPASYQAYVAGVRSEYAHVSPDDWRTGRTRVAAVVPRPAVAVRAHRPVGRGGRPGHGPTWQPRWHR